MTAALEGGEWSAARPGRTLPPGKTRYRFYRRLGGPPGLVWTGGKSRPHRDSIPDRPARSSVTILTTWPTYKIDGNRNFSPRNSWFLGGKSLEVTMGNFENVIQFLLILWRDRILYFSEYWLRCCLMLPPTFVLRKVCSFVVLCKQYQAAYASAGFVSRPEANTQGNKSNKCIEELR